MSSAKVHSRRPLLLGLLPGRCLALHALLPLSCCLGEQTLPKLPGKPLPATATPRVKASSQTNPEQLFTQLGCAGCHAEGARYRAVLKRSREKPTAEVARWIRNPQASAPGTQMPTYAQLLDESQAMSLAAWVQQHAATIP
ncbi:cytochrome c [Archangium violaceum]|uniref:c-type cytochrome n=1 Tax=Archangium violaceum TaxID=83451 RepID=UPI00193B0113|nr:cytochrome c [Archangium violaceum]QRK10117.1 cytochrome c [Archangium violaceum]